MRKIQAITATKDNRDDVESAMMQKSENFSVKLTKARETVPNYDEKKSTHATTADSVFASILKGDQCHGKDALRSNSTRCDIDDDQSKSIYI